VLEYFAFFVCFAVTDGACSLQIPTGGVAGFKCQVCSNLYPTEADLATHMSKRHNDNTYSPLSLQASSSVAGATTRIVTPTTPSVYNSRATPTATATAAAATTQAGLYVPVPDHALHSAHSADTSGVSGATVSIGYVNDPVSM